jgi:hypothetical protein
MDAALVTSPSHAIENVQRYNRNLAKFADLMPYARAWYALKTKDAWLFGPSKYIGYQGLSPDDYVTLDLDGRVTESVLQRWSELIEDGHPQYKELHTALNELCARHGKKPNSLARISIIQSAADHSVPQVFTDDLVALLAAVFRSLSPAQKAAFRKLAA